MGRIRTAILAIAMLSPAAASAQQLAPAEQLFVEGRKLLEEKRYPEACAKLQASHDLDPTATGTLLNLAVCHEAVDKPATAWAEFRQVIAESVGRRDDRVTIARAHEEKLYPILARLTIAVPASARSSGLEVKLDGRVVPEAAWGGELPIDPGTHRIEASAPGKLPSHHDVTIGAGPTRERIVLATLAAAPQRAEVEDRSHMERAAALRTRRGIGFGAAGLGVAAIGVGLAFGLVAKGKENDATGACPNDRCPSPTAVEGARTDHDAARSDATIATIAVGVGGLLAVGGVVLLLASRSDEPAPKRTALALRVVEGALLGATW